MTYIIIASICAVLFLPIVFLTLIPVMPAIPLLFILTMLFGVATKFTTLPWWAIMIFTIIFVLSILIDYGAGILGARFGRASRRSMIWGFVGIILGTLLLPPFGGIAGLFLGVLISELTQRRLKEEAFRSASFALVGAVIGIVLNFLLALTYYILFLVVVF
jgi:uncharacterized protein YqgC (DUF456 family)